MFGIPITLLIIFFLFCFLHFCQESNIRIYLDGTTFIGANPFLMNILSAYVILGKISIIIISIFLGIKSSWHVILLTILLLINMDIIISAPIFSKFNKNSLLKPSMFNSTTIATFSAIGLIIMPLALIYMIYILFNI